MAALGLAAGAAALVGVPLAEARFAAHGPPGAKSLAEPVVMRGRVAERLDAGRYGYLRIAVSGSPDRWLVAVKPKARAGDEVVARGVALARDFESRRLGRTFEELYFGSVQAAVP